MCAAAVVKIKNDLKDVELENEKTVFTQSTAHRNEQPNNHDDDKKRRASHWLNRAKMLSFYGYSINVFLT